MTVSAQPAFRHRRAGSQRYLLAKYSELGSLQKAYWQLVHLHDREPDSYRRLTGSERLPQYETIRRYWKEIPLNQRSAARRRYEHGLSR